MPRGNHKGSAFERAICKQLSLWWTDGQDDDIFWRSSQSGGRATQRAKKGKSTYGSYGDIAAVNPIGEPLLKIFTIELKRGMSHGEPGDLLDCTGDPRCHKFIQTLLQAEDAHKRAGSFSWLVIAKRDHRHVVVFFPIGATNSRDGTEVPLEHARMALLAPPVFRYRFGHFDFLGMKLEKFLELVRPEVLKQFSR